MKTTALTAWCLALAGCAGIADTTPPVPAAGTQLDGSYVGQDTLLSGVAFLCGAADLPERIEVQNGQFAYPFQVNPPRVAPLPVQIFEDGTLAGQMQYRHVAGGVRRCFRSLGRDWVTLRGRITGAALEATITNIRCVRRLRAQRKSSRWRPGGARECLDLRRHFTVVVLGSLEPACGFTVCMISERRWRARWVL